MALSQSHVLVHVEILTMILTAHVINVTKFFDLIFKHADEFHRWVDVFFEYSYVQKTGPVGLFNIKAVDPLRSTISTFKSCMARPMIKNSCDYHNVRFHHQRYSEPNISGKART